MDTAFVGPNNSGKSSLLRFFYEFRHLFSQISATNIRDSLHASLALNLFGLNENTEVFCRHNEGPLEIEFSYTSADYPEVREKQIPDSVTISVPHHQNSWNASIRYQGDVIPIRSERATDDGANRLSFPDGPTIDLGPIVECSQALANALYVGPFRNALNVPGTDAYFDIPVGQSFIKRWNEDKTGYSTAKNERIHSVSDVIRRIFGFNQLEINASADGSTLRLMIDGRSYKLSEIGSGLSQFIVVLGSAALAYRTFILIDEPELNPTPRFNSTF
jgi:hypothetical protein